MQSKYRNRFRQENTMSEGMKKFLLGAVVGAAAVSLMKTDIFRKSCSKLIAAGLQLKEDASVFFESVKEDAEDAEAEAKQKKANAAKA